MPFHTRCADCGGPLNGTVLCQIQPTCEDCRQLAQDARHEPNFTLDIFTVARVDQIRAIADAAKDGEISIQRLESRILEELELLGSYLWQIARRRELTPEQTMSEDLAAGDEETLRKLGMDSGSELMQREIDAEHGGKGPA